MVRLTVLVRDLVDLVHFFADVTAGLDVLAADFLALLVTLRGVRCMGAAVEGAISTKTEKYTYYIERNISAI
jgi:hypothetical protein